LELTANKKLRRNLCQLKVTEVMLKSVRGNGIKRVKRLASGDSVACLGVLWLALACHYTREEEQQSGELLIVLEASLVRSMSVWR
jgi:hypothetical protein